MGRKKKNNYVDNEKVQADFIEWKTRLKKIPGYPDSDIPEERLKHAQMPDSIAQAILDTANKFINDRRFSKYSWREEMIGDAIVNCVKYVHNYDPDKYANPHAYITQACGSAFIQRIKKEKSKLATKYKLYTDNVFDVDHLNGGSLDYEFYAEMVEKVNEYEESLAKQKAKHKAKQKEKEATQTKKGLDEFIKE